MADNFINVVEDMSDTEVVDVVSTNLNHTLTIHYDIHQKLQDDGELMADQTSGYYSYVLSSWKVPQTSIADDWFAENLPDFWDEYPKILNLSGYYYSKHNGEYKVALQPNITLGATYVGGSPSTFTFNKF